MTVSSPCKGVPFPDPSISLDRSDFYFPPLPHFATLNQRSCCHAQLHFIRSQLWGIAGQECFQSSVSHSVVDLERRNGMWEIAAAGVLFMQNITSLLSRNEISGRHPESDREVDHET